MAKAEQNRSGEELAAEYVLGTLDAAEHEAAELRLARDDDFASAVARWELRLEPLAGAIPAAEPPTDFLQRVHSRIDGASAESGATITSLRRRLRRTRTIAIISGALAACLAVVVVVREVTRPPDEEFVALLAPDGENPAFVASVDLRNGTITVIRVGEAPDRGHSFELWALGGDRKEPESLGLVDAHTRIPASRLGAAKPENLRDIIFAVSVEPKGGSPTGQPTGPVVFTGKLLPLSKIAPPQ